MIAFVANHLWQSTVVSAVAALLTIMVRRDRAQVRHALWLAASVKFLVPFAMLVAIGSQLGWRTGIEPRVTLAVEAISTPFSSGAAPAQRSRATSAWSKARVVKQAIVFTGLTVWFCGSIAIALGWGRRWRRVAAAVRDGVEAHSGRELEILRRLETRAGIGRPIALVVSDTTLEPGVWGMLNPVLLWPRSIGAHLDDAHVEAIVSHELAHVRRRDNLAAALHMCVQATFWFHPLVWWLGARLVDERERACDEDVVRLGSDPRVYAESILKTCELYVESPLACVAGVTGSDLEQRIERIMTNDVRDRLTAWKRLLLATAGAIAIAAPIAIGALTAPRLAAQSSSADAGQLAFATASVTPSATGDSGFYPLVITDGRFTAKNATLSALIRNLYPIPGFRMQGAPSWLNTEHFDFDARAEGNPTKEQMRAMVRTLLADRFKLIVHNETQQLPVYELVLITRDGTPGPQLRPSSPECVAAADAMHAGAAPVLPNGQRAVLAGPPLPAGVPCGGVNSRRDTFTARAATMEEVARGGFAPLLGQLVVNKTGLTGHFDADMTFTPAAEPPPPARAGGYGRAAPFIGPSFFAAVEEQLGLKLNPQTGPVDVLIIDRVERPTP